MTFFDSRGQRLYLPLFFFDIAWYTVTNQKYGAAQLIVLGIDPGYAILGYGVLHTDGTRLRAMEYGVVETDAQTPFPARLEKLYAGVRLLCERYAPDAVAFEELFFARNVTTAIQVGAGRGVALLAAQQSGAPLYEYTPMQIKLAVSGSGRADKKQMQQMVKLLLKLEAAPRPDDAADALGVAICHAHTMRTAAEEFRIK